MDGRLAALLRRVGRAGHRTAAHLTLFDRRGFRTGLTAVGVFTIGCVGIAGFAMLLVFFRLLVVTDAIDVDTIDAVSSEAGLAAVLYGWIAAFYLGELLLSIALFRAHRAASVPVVLLLHVALFPVSSLLPDELQSLTTLLVTVGLCGVGITANRHASKVLVDAGQRTVPVGGLARSWRRARPSGSAMSRA